MEDARPGDLTALLRRWLHGDHEAGEKLMPMVYGELRRIAGRHMQAEQEGHTLQATALVHEAYMRLAELKRLDCRDRYHFYNFASRVMRRVLVDHARGRAAEKRNGGAGLPPALGLETAVWEPERLLLLDASIDKLADQDPELARLVELKVFSGLSVAETARALRCSTATATRRWALARAWLSREVFDG